MRYTCLKSWAFGKGEPTKFAREGWHTVGQIFLSYSPQDERTASAIRAELRRDYGLNVWWDGDVPPGNDWLRQVSLALNRCDGMIVLVSPASMTSDLVKREVEHALTSEQFQDRLFPLVIRPTKHVPGYFSLMTVFNATENRKRGLKSVAKAIIASER
jgi:TIR domain